MFIFQRAKEITLFVYEIWNKIFYQLMPRYIPGALLVSFDHRWWHNLLVGALWVGIYAGLAWAYWNIIGWPFHRMRAHVNRHGCKVLAWWHVVIYIFLIIYTGQGSVITARSIDITPFLALLLIWLSFFIKGGWRGVYFPLAQVCWVLFLFGAFCFFIPLLLVLAAMMFFGGGLAAFAADDVYTCSGCGRKYKTTGRCGYCGSTVG